MMSALAWLSAALALLPLVVAWRNLPTFRRPHALPPPGTRVSILIPARNEEAAIERAVRRALASTGVDVEVRVFDDDSTDGTAAIVARLAADDPRLTLVRGAPLAPGWAGKQRACATLAAGARFDMLMFVDVDVLLAPQAAAVAVAALMAHPWLGMVSGFPREVATSLPERLVVPWIHVLLLGYLPMDRMRRSAEPAFGAACGQWIVARRDAYRATGGHAAVPASRHDGTSLPRLFRSAGWVTDVFDGSLLASCRMYDGWRSVWQGFSKSPGEGLATRTALPVWTVLIGLGHVMPPVWLVAGIASGHLGMFLAGAVGIVANGLLRGLLCTRLGQSRLGAVLHPVGAVLLLANQWYSLLRDASGRTSEWRGRRYVAAR